VLSWFLDFEISIEMEIYSKSNKGNKVYDNMNGVVLEEIDLEEILQKIQGCRGSHQSTFSKK